MDQHDQKREHIIDTALKRFAHFGLNKTTMNEIASDLNFSKALLYYYFPDKVNLYAAVIGKIFNEIASSIDSSLQTANTPEAALKVYIDARQEFLKKYFSILDFNKLSNLDKYQDLKKILEKANETEIIHLKEIIDIGIRAGRYEVKDSLYTAKLLFEALLGIRIFYINERKSQFGIDKDFLNMISDRQKEIVYIFLKGLSKA